MTADEEFRWHLAERARLLREAEMRQRAREQAAAAARTERARTERAESPGILRRILPRRA